MNQHIGLFPCLLDKIVGWSECMVDFLFVIVVQVEYDMLELLRVLVVKIDSWTDPPDSFAFELFDVVSKLIPTNPYFTELSFPVKDLLSWGVKLAKHKHFFLFN